MASKSEFQFVGVVLAGGFSSRMGQDKALLELEGETLMHKTARILTELGASQVFICRNQNSQGFIQDVFPHCGPLSGIHSALLHTDLPVLVVPVDLPLLQFDSLQPLLSKAIERDDNVHFENNNLPALIQNRNHTIDYLTNTLKNAEFTDLSVRGLFRNIGVTLVPKAESVDLTNVNTPEQWLLAQQQNEMSALVSHG